MSNFDRAKGEYAECRALAESPKATLDIEGFDGFVTSTAAPIATGWSDRCRVGYNPTESPRLCHGARNHPG